MALVIHDDQFMACETYTLLIDRMPETDREFEQLVVAVNSYVEKTYGGLHSDKGYRSPLTIFVLKQLFEYSRQQYRSEHNEYDIYLSYQPTVLRSSDIIRE